MVLNKVDNGQRRPLDSVYPIIFIGTMRFLVKEDQEIRKLAAYVFLAVDIDGHKDVINLQIGENESNKYWLGALK